MHWHFHLAYVKPSVSRCESVALGVVWPNRSPPSLHRRMNDAVTVWKGHYINALQLQAQWTKGLTGSCFLVRNSWSSIHATLSRFCLYFAFGEWHTRKPQNWVDNCRFAGPIASCDLLIQSFDVGQFFPESCCNRSTRGSMNAFRSVAQQSDTRIYLPAYLWFV